MPESDTGEPQNPNPEAQANGAIETDAQRQARTGLSSLQMGEDAAAAAAKTEDRVALSRMQKKVVAEEFINPASTPHMTICVLSLENGFSLVGKAAPADPTNFDLELGKKFAYEDALRQLWPLEGYLLRQFMWQQDQPPAAEDQPL